MSNLFVGWDVGAWNCDRNPKSRDALCALEIRAGGRLVVAGEPWRGNLRPLLVTASGSRLIDGILELLRIPRAARRRAITIAIDTPLAWPRAMLELVMKRRAVEVPPEADRNPYLFRAQERELFDGDLRPLSAVRDMIGSQSTKGIHFLQRTGLTARATGVWGGAGVMAIETYPSAVRDRKLRAKRDMLVATSASGDGRARTVAWQHDVRDAITCALVAWLYRTDRGRLAPPTRSADPAEGWIWLPRTTARRTAKVATNSRARGSVGEE